MNITLTESAAFGVGFRLDKQNGIAYGVAVCGKTSANNRDYPDDVRDRDKHLYEGASCFLDHGGGERKVREWFGTLKNTRTRLSDKKTIADLHYPKTSQFTAEFEERAERFPGSFGFSHVAVCETKRINGRESITAIKQVHSVDLVARPATNAGLFESVTFQRGVPTMEAAARLIVRNQFNRREQTVLLEAAAMAGGETIAKTDAMIAGAERRALMDGLEKVLEQFKAGKMNASAFSTAVVELLDRLGHSAGGVERESVTVPTEGAEFVRWLKGQPSPEEARRFADSLKYPDVRYASTQTIEDRLRTPPASGTVPTEGKQFAEWLKSGGR